MNATTNILYVAEAGSGKVAVINAGALANGTNNGLLGEVVVGSNLTGVAINIDGGASPVL